MRQRRRRQDPYAGPPKTVTDTWTPQERAEHERLRRRGTAIAELQVSVRVVNALEEKGVFLAGDLYDMSRDDIAAVGNFGTKTVGEVALALAQVGLPRPDLDYAVRANETRTSKSPKAQAARRPA